MPRYTENDDDKNHNLRYYPDKHRKRFMQAAAEQDKDTTRNPFVDNNSIGSDASDAHPNTYEIKLKLMEIIAKIPEPSRNYFNDVAKRKETVNSIAENFNLFLASKQIPKTGCIITVITTSDYKANLSINGDNIDEMLKMAILIKAYQLKPQSSTMQNNQVFNAIAEESPENIVNILSKYIKKSVMLNRDEDALTNTLAYIVDTINPRQTPNSPPPTSSNSTPTTSPRL